ncbi:MAG: preprotein translocase subunit SecG [Verrucomicrobia bacterium]|nr:preprotein translocase subunit SecG [Verrucomicrobiota bacterium]
MSIVLGILTFILILVSLFIVLVVLAQKSKDGGMGAALGGGAAEAAFGAETGNVLSRSTIYAAILFFVLAFALYLGRIYENKHPSGTSGEALPSISAPPGQIYARRHLAGVFVGGTGDGVRPGRRAGREAARAGAGRPAGRSRDRAHLGPVPPDRDRGGLLS